MNIITSHYNIDFDGFASMVAASKLYDNSELYMPWGFDKAVKRFYIFYKHKFRVKKDKDIDLNKGERVIIVDGMMRVLSQKLRDVIEKKNLEIILYNHHFMEEKLKPNNLKIIDVAYGACTTYFVEELIRKGIEITEEEAMLYLLGIFSDTGNFTYPNTTTNDLKAAARLMEMNVNMKQMADFLRGTLESSQLKLFNRLMKNMENVESKGHKVIITYARFKEHIQGLSDVTSQLMSINSAGAIVSIAQMGNKIFIVGRSNDKKIDIRKILHVFKGGGHKTAAAAVIPVKKGVTIKSLKNSVYEGVISNIEERYTVKDIMSSPVRAVSPDLTIDEAYKICIRFNNNGLPVVKSDKLVGFITKEDIEKGKLHGLGSIPVSGYMSTNVITVNEDVTIPEAQHIMLKNNIGHLPVIRKTRMVGIVTRTDILGFLYAERPHRKDKIVFKETNLNIKQAMSEKLDSGTYELIKQIGEHADSAGINAYLVGGMVRDIFLKAKDLDVDITVEGDGMQFASFLADKMGGAYKGFDRFKTAKVFLKNGRRIDVASARAEFYEFPAALPDIEFTPLRYDLYRRDFTINAMAIQINANSFGRFNDYFNGYEDLQNGLIKILYNMSFIDDPTRIIRAVRFEARYNFKIEENTLRFIKETIKYNIFDTLPGERLRDEFMILMEEDSPLKAVKRMQQLNILTRLNPGFVIDEKIENTYKEAVKFLELEETQKKFAPFNSSLIYFMIFIGNLTELQGAELVNRLKFKNDWKKAVASAKQEKKLTGMLERAKMPNSRIFEALKEIKNEALLYLYVASEKEIVKKRLRDYYLNLSKVKPEISGKDLKGLGVAPGPLYSEIMDKVTEAKLDNRIKNKKEALTLAKRLANGSSTVKKWKPKIKKKKC